MPKPQGPQFNSSDDAEDFDDDDETSTEDREANEAYLEYSKITPEEMDARIERQRAAKERLWSPEYLEESRLKRVERNKGKETNLFNADGTMKPSPPAIKKPKKGKNDK